MSKIRLGIAGLGHRGYMLMDYTVLPRENVSVVAVCDIFEDRANEARDRVKEVSGVEAEAFTDYVDMLNSAEMDAVLISTSWEYHLPIAIMAMEKGIAVAMEVGGAYNEHELWKLVDTYEQTKTPFMILENCNYGRNELMLQNMIEQGVFGEIVHLAGGYRHDLRYEIAGGVKNRHYRLKNYLLRNTENYPTHEIGPIAKFLNLGQGNRMESLVSVSSKSAGMSAYLQDKKEEYPDLQNLKFKQGDVVTTIIKCAGGETITLTLDTTLPRYYSRGLEIMGTKGMYNEENQSIYIDNEPDHEEAHFDWQKQWGNLEDYREEYEHPIWKDYLNSEVQDAHGGMDWLVLDAFFNALDEGSPMPLDVYDAVSWMVITDLSEKSIALGGQVQYFPDFTKGKWVEAYNF